MAQEMQVEYGGAIVPHGGTIELPRQTIGARTANQRHDLIVRNVGDAPLNVGLPHATGDFDIEASGAGAIAPGATRTFQILLTNQRMPKRHRGVLSIPNDGVASPFIVNVTQVRVGAPAPRRFLASRPEEEVRP